MWDIKFTKCNTINTINNHADFIWFHIKQQIIRTKDLSKVIVYILRQIIYVIPYIIT